MKTPSRSAGPAYSRRSQAIEPSAASSSSSGPPRARSSVTSPSQASSPSTFSRPISPPPTTRQRRPAQLQARDVERRVEHVAHAGLVADPAPELADAFLPGVGGGRHRPHRVVRPYLGHEACPQQPASPTTRCCAACIREQVVGLSGPRALLHAGGAPGRLRGLLRAHRRARRALRAPEPHGARARPRSPSAPAEDADRATAPRARHAPPRARRAAPRRPGASPAGTPYAADDPALLLWILAALADSAAVVYQRYVARAERAPSARRCGPTTASSGASSACATPTCPRRGTTSRPTCSTWSRARTCTSPTRRASSRVADRHAPAGPAARAPGRSSSPTRSRSACCRRACAASTASPGTRCARSRSAAARSTPSASWCRCCPSACGWCAARGGAA